jgi:hypothetical protein
VPSLSNVHCITFPYVLIKCFHSSILKGYATSINHCCPKLEIQEKNCRHQSSHNWLWCDHS